jgi:hypothetical protein
MDYSNSTMTIVSCNTVRAVFLEVLSGATLLLCARGGFAQDFSTRVERIHYQDDVGREILYDFSSGTMDQDGVVTIPTDAVLGRPAAESDTTYVWRSGLRQESISFQNGIYAISVPQALELPPSIPSAKIVVDGVVSDWADVDAHILDPVDDVAGGSTDVEYVKLAYNSDGSRLNMLIKAKGSIEQAVWYRLFLDRDLDARVGEPGDFQIDFEYWGTAWDVVSQGWNSDDGWDWYPVTENGAVVVSGQFIEGSVDSAAFGLPRAVNVYGRTMLGESPYTQYDRFSTRFMAANGYAALGAVNPSSLVTEQWHFAARFSNFENVLLNQHRYEIGVGCGEGVTSGILAAVSAFWFTGYLNTTYYDSALVIQAVVENEEEWEWFVDTGGGLIIGGLDPAATVVDLKTQVTNSGKTVSFYYRINSDSEQAWQAAIDHTLTGASEKALGAWDSRPTAWVSTGFTRDTTVPTFASDSADFADVPFLHAQAGDVRTYQGQAGFSGTSYAMSFSQTGLLGVTCLRVEGSDVPAHGQEAYTLWLAKDTSGRPWVFKFVFDGATVFEASSTDEIIPGDQPAAGMHLRLMTGDWEVGTTVIDMGGNTQEVLSTTATLPQFPGRQFIKVKRTSSDGSDIDYEYHHESVGLVMDIWDDSGIASGDAWVLDGFAVGGDLHDWNGDAFVSIIGDVPPFVQCVYFGDCPGGVDLLAVGDCNEDGLLSIIGDVPCFVDCVYFGNCPE